VALMDEGFTGRDVIEVLSAVIADAGGFPVKLCQPVAHTHKVSGVDQPCRSAGKRPIQPQWEQGSPAHGMRYIYDWLDKGLNIGWCLDRWLVGLDEDQLNGLDKFFAALGEPIPVTMGDIVPLTGKRHLVVRMPEGFDMTRLKGTFYDSDGKAIGELIHSRTKQLVAPGNPWTNSDLTMFDFRVWNGVADIVTLSAAAAEALVPPNERPRMYETNGASSDWQWNEEDDEARHILLRNKNRELAGTVRDVKTLADITWQWGESHGLTGMAKGREVTYAEVLELSEGAIRGYPADPAPVTLNVPRIEGHAPYVAPVVIPTTGMFVNVLTYHAVTPANIEWVSPLAAYGFVSLIAGPPKGGKSTLLAGLLREREVGGVYLWGDPVPKGPMVLVTEEGGLAVVRKTLGLTTLDILDRRNFFEHGLSKLEHLLAALTQWCGERERALIVIDTLAIWGDIKDENDATAATQAVALLTLLTQQTQSAMVLAHHARKGGGDHGEGIRGSGAIFATVDQAIELGYVTDKTSDNRLLTLSGRLIFPEIHELGFDRGTNTYKATTSTYTDPYPIDRFPTSTSGQQGLTRQDAEAIWGVSQSKANTQLKALVEQGRLTKTMVKDGRNWRGDYHRVVLLDLSVDTRSVGERMAGLFAETDAATLPPLRGESSVAASEDEAEVGPAPDLESGGSDN
jgi:hypothetical protein